jgi:hypothetical protein
LPGFEVGKKKALDIIKVQYNGYEYPVQQKTQAKRYIVLGQF